MTYVSVCIPWLNCLSVEIKRKYCETSDDSGTPTDYLIVADCLMKADSCVCFAADLHANEINYNKV